MRAQFNNKSKDKKEFLRKLEQAQRKLLLNKHKDNPDFLLIYLALKQNKIATEFENVVSIDGRVEFKEALVRVPGLSPEDVFQITTDKDFHTWLFTKQLRDYDAGRLSINVSPSTLEDKGFQANLEAIANSVNLDFLILEALETESWTHSAIEKLKDLRSKFNISVAIDDYNPSKNKHNLEELKKIQPDIIKLDGELVRDYLDNGNSGLLNTIKLLKQEFPKASLVTEWVEIPGDMIRIISALGGIPILGQGRQLKL